MKKATLVLLCTLCVFWIAGCLLATDSKEDEPPWSYFYTQGFEANEVDDVSLDTYEGIPTFNYDDTVFRSPGRSVSITADSNSRGAASVLVPLEEGCTYRVSLYYKTDEQIQNNRAQVRLWMLYDKGVRVTWDQDSDYIVDDEYWGTISTGGNIASVGLPRAPYGWQYLTVELTPPTGAKTLVINMCNFFGQGTVWFDDLQVTVPPGTPNWQFDAFHGFETNSSDVTFGAYEGSPVTWYDNNTARSGSRSLALQADASSRGAASIRVRVRGGEHYQLSLYYKTDDKIKPKAAGVRLCFEEPGGVRSLWTVDNDHIVDAREWGSYSIGGGLATLQLDRSGDWQRLSVVVKAPNEATVLNINPINFFGEGTVWFDDFEIISPPYN